MLLLLQQLQHALPSLLCSCLRCCVQLAAEAVAAVGELSEAAAAAAGGEVSICRRCVRDAVGQILLLMLVECDLVSI